jgi:hypothetical protein
MPLLEGAKAGWHQENPRIPTWGLGREPLSASLPTDFVLESAGGKAAELHYRVRVKEGRSIWSREARFGIDESLIDEMYWLEIDGARRSQAI